MADQLDVGSLLEAAQSAAGAGDLATAAASLRQALALQESALGRSHPDLASTLNNLAIIAERTGQLKDAEVFYRRAARIAAESLPPEDPLAAASRENLADFCAAQGLPADLPAPAAQRLAKRDTETGLDAFARETETAAEVFQERPPAAPPRLLPHVAPVAPPGAIRRWAVGLLLVLAAFLIGRQLWSADPRPPVKTVEIPAPPAVPDRRVEPPSAPEPSPPKPSPRGEITLAVAEVCQVFSPDSAPWRCEPAGEFARSGTLVLYTRVRTPRDAVIVHRWYRGETLYQTVRLTVGANPGEGYRTYSRQTVEAGSEWRVTVETAAGEILHDRRFVVR